MGGLLMDIWSVLEIKPTDDVGTIKKAYAKKLKLHYPEEDPVGHQTLRQAYDKALKLAKDKKAITHEKSFEYKNDVIPAEEIYEDIEPKKLNEHTMEYT
jgi:curved DNA-binding protein CbpA